MVENYGENLQERPIPNPVITFEEAFKDYRKYICTVQNSYKLCNFSLCYCKVKLYLLHVYSSCSLGCCLIQT